MMRKLLLCGVVALALCAPAAQARPFDDMLEVQVLPGWRTAGGAHVAALKMVLKDGWKTYWRAPGDAGIPPRFDWSGSRNLSAVEVNWPTPKQMHANGVRTIGYDTTLVLPLTLTPTRAGRPIALFGRVDMGLCREVCVPVTLNISSDLPFLAGQRDPQIVAALAEQPYSAAEAGVTRAVCTVSPMKGGIHLRAELDIPPIGAGEAAVVETDNPNIWVAEAETTRRGGRLIAETELYHTAGQAFALNRSGLRITVLGKSHAVDIRGCASP